MSDPGDDNGGRKLQPFQGLYRPAKEMDSQQIYEMCSLLRLVTHHCKIQWEQSPLTDKFKCTGLQRTDIGTSHCAPKFQGDIRS